MSYFRIPKTTLKRNRAADLEDDYNKRQKRLETLVEEQKSIKLELEAELWKPSERRPDETIVEAARR